MLLFQEIHFLKIFIYLFIYLFLAVLGLRFCARAFSSCGERGPLFIVVCGPLTVAASLVAEHRLQMRRLSSCGTWAQLLHGMWDIPRPGLEPVSPALAGRFSTTAPRGKPLQSFLRTFSECVLELGTLPFEAIGWFKTTEICCLPVLEAKSLKSGCQLSHVLTEASEEGTFLASSSFWQSLVIPQLVAA